MITREETISSELVYKGKVINLRKDKVTVKGGRTATREIVEHNGAVAIVALTDDGKVLVEKQFRKPVDDIVLEIPAGKIDPGEDPEQTAIRELREETGYIAEKAEYLTKFYPSVGYCEEIIYIYLCTDLKKGDTDFDDDEEIELIEDKTLDDLTEMIMKGEIIDCKTMVAVGLTKEWLRRNR